ncbi:MAG: GFA family protein [Alphaproteobacteria bacterium]
MAGIASRDTAETRSQGQKTEGGCLCGAVRYAIRGPIETFQYCHCSRCRRASGAAFAANLFVPPEQFVWLAGENTVVRYEVPEAAAFGTAFCPACGSPAPRLGRNGKAVKVPAGGLDAHPGQTPQRSIFWDSRAAWLEETATLPRFPEMP